MRKTILFLVLVLLVIQVVGAKEFNILDFGAVRNQLSTFAIQKAIDTCHETGGGTVVVPAGIYITGAIILKSNINLYLESGAELRSSENMGDFTVGSERYGMIFCQDASAIRIGYGQHPIRRCIFTDILISESNRGIGVFAHDASNIEELIFSNIIIETRLHNGIWWGNGEPIHLSAISRFTGQPAGQIKDVQFNNITATGGQGIVIYGDKESHMENIQFNNVQLCLLKGLKTMSKGGNFDLRPTAIYEKQIFEHDIPGLFAQYVDNLSIRNFGLKWGEGLPEFFTHGIECLEVKDLLIDGFVGSANPNSPKSQKLFMEKCTVRQ